MVRLTTEVSTDTLVTTPKMVEVSLAYIYEINGKMVNRMLKFFVSEEQSKQYQNTVDLGVL